VDRVEIPSKDTASSAGLGIGSTQLVVRPVARIDVGVGAEHTGLRHHHVADEVVLSRCACGLSPLP